MSEALNTPIQITAGSGKVTATWIDGRAIWTSDYKPRGDNETETLQFTRRSNKLRQAFDKYGLDEPEIEVIKMGELAVDIVEGIEHEDVELNASAIGEHVLRVTALLRPNMGLAHMLAAADAPMLFDETIIAHDLTAGGQAIYDAFGPALRRSNSGNM